MKLDWVDPDLAASLEAMSEVQRVALVLAGEARSEPIEGLIGVANVIRNRVKADLGNDGKADWWGEGFSDVVTRPQQFSCLFEAGGKGNLKFVKSLAKQFASGEEVTDPKVLRCVGVATLITAAKPYLDDNTKASTHYCVYTLSPAWSKGHKPAVRLGVHHFFNSVK